MALGDPVGDVSEWKELIWEFKQLARLSGGKAVFWEISSENLTAYLDAFLRLLKIGEEAKLSLHTFSLSQPQHRDLRSALKHASERKWTFEILPPNSTPEIYRRLGEISKAWLASKKAREKRFSVGFFDVAYLKRFPIAVVRCGEEMIAFGDLWLGAEKSELSLDLMRYAPDKTSHGVMDYLFAQVLLWGKAQGYEWFNLGMAPLAGLNTADEPLLWRKLGNWVFRHGEHFYNFQGLRSFKEKFAPVWSPKYLASPGGLAVPRVLADISRLSSGGFKPLFFK